MKRIAVRFPNTDDFTYSLVDDEDFALLSQKAWTLRAGYVTGAVRTDKRRHRKGRGWARCYAPYAMHRIIMGLPRKDPREVDHINGNKADNRKSNLRIVTHAMQMQNLKSRSPQKGTKHHSQYRGVRWQAKAKKWRAAASVQGFVSELGLYESEEEAGRVVQKWRVTNMPYANEERHPTS